MYLTTKFELKYQPNDKKNDFMVKEKLFKKKNFE